MAPCVDSRGGETIGRPEGVHLTAEAYRGFAKFAADQLKGKVEPGGVCV
jgi:hypothetical protein